MNMVTVDDSGSPPHVPEFSSPPASPTPSAAASCAQELDDICLRLEAVNSTVAVAAGALEGQNAEIDLDVARTLRTSVRDVLSDQVERLSALIQKLQ
jgi:hypothetical protein